MRFVCIALQAFSVVLFAWVVLQWIPVDDEHPIGRLRSAMGLVIRPILAPVRALVPPVRMGSVAIDLSPLIVILAASLLASFLC